MKVETAVGELAVEYEGRVRFNIVSAEETAKRGDEIELYGFTEQLHGLVALDPSGAPVAKLPGHMFGKDEIREAIEATLVVTELRNADG